MTMDRRDFLGFSGLGLTTLGFWSQAAGASEGKSAIKVGMCDWNVVGEDNRGGTCRPELIPRAKEAHLEGIQVSVGRRSQVIFSSGYFHSTS